MLPKIQLVDSHKNLLTGLSFHGTTSVQNVASFNEQYFSCCTICTGIELTVSLLSDKVMAIRPMREMCGFAKKDESLAVFISFFAYSCLSLFGLFYLG